MANRLHDFSKGSEITHKAFIKHSWAIVAVALAALLAGCTSLHVRTGYSHSANFSDIHTCSWLKVSAGNPLWADRIQRDVNAQLASRGWMDVPSGGQAEVTAFGSTREQPTLETFYSGFGPGFGGFWGPGFDGGYATTEVVNTPIGSLVVDIFNDHTKHLIWRGVAQQARSGSPEKNADKLAKASARCSRASRPQPRPGLSTVPRCNGEQHFRGAKYNGNTHSQTGSHS